MDELDRAVSRLLADILGTGIEPAARPQPNPDSYDGTPRELHMIAGDKGPAIAPERDLSHLMLAAQAL